MFRCKQNNTGDISVGAARVIVASLANRRCGAPKLICVLCESVEEVHDSVQLNAVQIDEHALT